MRLRYVRLAGQHSLEPHMVRGLHKDRDKGQDGATQLGVIHLDGEALEDAQLLQPGDPTSDRLSGHVHPLTDLFPLHSGILAEDLQNRDICLVKHKCPTPFMKQWIRTNRLRQQVVNPPTHSVSFYMTSIMGVIRMRVQLIRHATLRVDLGGHRFLVDPMLSEMGAMDPIANAANSLRIPMTPLPFSVDEILDGVDALLITHLHRDHLDDAAVGILPRGLPLFCQPADSRRLRELGFTDIRPVSTAAEFEGIELIRTAGKHGVGLVGQLMGRVSGFVLRSPGEPSLYIAGDTIWCGAVREVLETITPDVVILNAGGAQFRSGSPITMTSADVARVSREHPAGEIIAVHMDAINHCLTTRQLLRAALVEQGLERVHIPPDGAVLEFPGV